MGGETRKLPWPTPSKCLVRDNLSQDNPERAGVTTTRLGTSKHSVVKISNLCYKVFGGREYTVLL